MRCINMKGKKMVLVGLASLMLVAVPGCEKYQPAVKPEITCDLPYEVNEEGVYDGFLGVHSDITKDEAIKDGCYVVENGTPVGNEEMWKFFQSSAKEGKEVGLRIVSIYDENKPIYDLFYHEDGYYVYDFASTIDRNGPYSYLLNLKGTFTGADEETELTVLANEEELTFEEIDQAMAEGDGNGFEEKLGIQVLYVN